MEVRHPMGVEMSQDALATIIRVTADRYFRAKLRPVQACIDLFMELASIYRGNFRWMPLRSVSQAGSISPNPW